MQVPNTGGDYRAFELHDGSFNDGSDRKLQIGTGENGSSDYFVRLFEVNTDGFYGSLGTINTGVNLIVLKFTLGTGLDEDGLDVWFNPTGAELTTEAMAGSPDYTKTGFNISFDRTSLANFDDGVVLDELRLGSSWAEVVALSDSVTVPILGIAASGNDAVISFEAEGGLTYQLQKRSSLTGSNWYNAAEPFTNTGGGVESVTDTDALLEETGFYRVVVLR